MSISRSGVETIFNNLKLTYSKGDMFLVYLGQLSGAFQTEKEKEKENPRNFF